MEKIIKVGSTAMQCEILSHPEYAAKFPGGHKFYDGATNAKWTGATIPDARAMLKNGDMSQVARAEKLQQYLHNDYQIEGSRVIMSPGVVGCFPNVPAMLAGIPETMLAPSEQPDAQGEIVILAESFISASFKVDAYQRRGAALLALVQYIQAIRPVRLISTTTHARDYDHSDVVCSFVDLPCNPLDISRAGFLLAHSAAFRVFGLDRYYKLGGKSSMPWGGASGIPESRSIPVYQAALGVDDIILTPPLVSKSGATPFDTDKSAAQWVQAQVDRALKRRA